MLPRLSLKVQLALIGIVLQGLLLGVVSLNTVRLVERNLAEELAARGELLRPLFNSALAVPMVQRDYASVAAILEESRQSSELLYLLVRDAAGQEIARTGVLPSAAAAAAAPDGSLALATELRLGGQYLGEVMFGLSGAEIAATRAAIERDLLWAGLLALVFFSTLLWAASALLTRPLMQLVRASRDIRAGRYDIDLPATRADELGLLMDAFASMSAEIKRKVAELERSDELQRQYLRDGFRKQVALEKALISAEAATQAKSAFLANMSHEVRTPMNAVLGFAQLLEATPLDSSQRAHLAHIHSAGDALMRIINDILDYSKIEAGQMQVEQAPFSLAALVTEVSEMFAYVAQQKQVALQVDLDSGLPALLLGDAARLRQVLTNLLGNALKFTERGQVCLRVNTVDAPPGDERHWLAFEVSDTGIGMTPAQCEGIFEAFAQADASITRRFGGTGLGLSISQRLVGLMGGRLAVQSEAGVGSRFHFQIPLALASVSQPDPWPPADAPAEDWRALQGRRVLLAEDHPINRLLIERFLLDAGMEVVWVDNGRDACEQLRQQRVDLVLMDLQMPEMDGFEAASRIRAELGALAPPIIALTASALLQDRQACEQAGMADHIAKPVIRAHLYRTLLHWLPSVPPAVPAADVPPSGAPAASVPLPLAAAQRVQRDALLAQLADRLSHNLLTARGLLEKIDPLLVDPAHRALFREVSAATRQFRFANALALLKILNERLVPAAGDHLP